MLLSANCDVDARNEKCGTHLCLCLKKCSLLTLCSVSQRTPLHCSSREGHAEICEMLLSANCDVNASDQKCGTHLCLFFATVFADDFLSHQAMHSPALFHRG